MDNLSKNQDNHQPKNKIWQWIAIFAVLLSLISGSFLLYQWWKNQQANKQLKVLKRQLEQAEQKEKNQALQSYQNQQKQLPQVLILANNPTIHEFFNDLLSGYAYRFAEKHNLTAYCLPLSFWWILPKNSPSRSTTRGNGKLPLSARQAASNY